MTNAEVGDRNLNLDINLNLNLNLNLTALPRHDQRSSSP